MFEDLGRRRGFAECVNPQRINAPVLTPPAGHTGFDTDSGQTMTQDFFAVGPVLTIENRTGGNRDHPYRAAPSLEQSGCLSCEADLGARCQDDRSCARAILQDITATLNGGDLFGCARLGNQILPCE